MLEQGPVFVITKQSGCATKVKLAFKESCASKSFGSVDPFKAAADRRQLAHGKGLALLCLHLCRGKAQSLLRPPENQSGAAQREKQNGNNGPTPLQSAENFHFG